MIDKYLRLLIEQIDDKIEHLQEALTNGSPRDFTEYKEMVGVVKGLRISRLNLTDLRSKTEESDD
jgi:hypothetical protein